MSRQRERKIWCWLEKTGDREKDETECETNTRNRDEERKKNRRMFGENRCLDLIQKTVFHLCLSSFFLSKCADIPFESRY